MKIRFLLIGTSLSLIPQTINAQCVATQDCATLGYTETSCSGGTGVKCPFGNKWACFKSESEIKNQLCTELGFTLSCTGTNQTGVGQTCNGKYTKCTCSSGYEWKEGRCQEQVLNGPDGDVYKCNGAIVGVKASGLNFYIAMKDRGLMNQDSAYRNCISYSFCNNLKGTLPTKDQLLSIYNNKSTINNLLSTHGGTELTEDYYWSNTYYYNNGYGNDYYVVHMSNGFAKSEDAKNYIHEVRPILTSW